MKPLEFLQQDLKL